MLACIVPAHNEEDHIERCVESLQRAARHWGLQGETTSVLVVLDRCGDRTEARAKRLGVETLTVDAGSVGMARHAGALSALARGARWLAFTDADSEVAPDWLTQQLMLECSVVCGTVQVSDWSSFSAAVRCHYESRYSDCDGHRHVHGANLGISAQAYLGAGGFAPLRCNEDVALVRRLEAAGLDIAWSSKPRVRTSARRHSRLVGGFASHLQAIESVLECVRGAPA